MKKWDDDFRMKSYVNKIQKAKSTVPGNQKKTIKSIQRKSIKEEINRDTEFSSHQSYRSDLTDIKESLLFKQLYEYNLQQYMNKLFLRGYIGGLHTLAQQPIDSQNLVLQEIKLLPGHKQKFLDLFKYLNDHYDPHNYNGQASLTPNNNKQNRNTLPGQQNSHGKFEQTRDTYVEILKPVNRRSSLKHISPLQEIGVIKPRVLPKLEKHAINGLNDRSPQFSDTQSKQLVLNQDIAHGSSLSITKEMVSKPFSKTINHPVVKLKYTKKKKSTIKTNSDKDNKLVKKLLQINSKNSIGAEILLQQDQIQLMYQSFDNGKLASTLINIDIEEISYCVGITLQKMITIADLEQQRNLENEIQEIQQAIFKESDQYEEIQSRNQGRYSEDFQDEENNDQTVNMSKVDENICQDYLKEAIIEPEITDQYYSNEDVATEQFQKYDQSEQSKLQTEQQLQDYCQDQEEEQENKDQVSKSYFSVDTTYNLEDYLLFNKVFVDKSMSNYIPNVDIIQNYCKNIMTTTKMEREVAIISMIYINRLLNYNQGLEINCLNWQKILFTALVMASKIWDDESFENNNFAKVLPQFSTLQINEMEKVFLKLIEYHLYVNSGEYAKQYFILRTYADKKQRSYALKQLDILTVLRLQRGDQQQISKQQYLNTQNKSF